MIQAIGPAIEMPGPPEAGYELLHFRYMPDIADLYQIPLNDDERQFIDAYYAKQPTPEPGLREIVASVKRRFAGPRYVGFKTFPTFHRYNEFFERSDITFIVLHRRNLDLVFLSWCVATFRDNYEQAFNAKLGDFRFAQLAKRPEGLRWMMRDFLFNLRGMSNLISRGAIELVVDEDERVVNSPRLNEFFGATMDFSDINHRSDYTALPDLDLFYEHFWELLSFWKSRSTTVSSLVEAFESNRGETIRSMNVSGGRT
jgi:hypothetical protein